MDLTAAQSPSPRPQVADRLRAAARLEFSGRGYHGARVLAIARRAGCNVALLYRHWDSKRALYLDVLRAVWRGVVEDAGRAIDAGGGPEALVIACLDANLHDPMGARIILRELLDGGPVLSSMVAAEPALLEPIRRAALALQPASDAVEPTMAVLAIGGLAALLASAQDSVRTLLPEPVTPERWRAEACALLLRGVAGAGGAGARPPRAAMG